MAGCALAPTVHDRYNTTAPHLDLPGTSWIFHLKSNIEHMVINCFDYRKPKCEVSHLTYNLIVGTEPYLIQSDEHKVNFNQNVTDKTANAVHSLENVFILS